MMSPLALLQEGEIAEIIDPAGQTRDNDTGGHYGHGGCHCQASLKDAPCCSASTGPHHHTHGHSHLHDMGLRPGKIIEMITNSGTGPLVLRVDECRIAMGRGEAMKIYVRRNVQ